jgi:hypothetical protein
VSIVSGPSSIGFTIDEPGALRAARLRSDVCPRHSRFGNRPPIIAGMSLRLIAICATALVAAAAVAVLQPWASSERSKRGAPVGNRAAALAPFPPPTATAVLTVTGVARGNVGRHVTRVDFATLDRFATRTVKIHEPFLKRDVEVSGIPMDEVLRRAGVGASARELKLHALDDYEVGLPVSGVVSDALLATRLNGAPMKIAKGGPIRLVFIADSKLAANTDNWIWSIGSIRVTR